jgi:hypothetical protein
LYVSSSSLSGSELDDTGLRTNNTTLTEVRQARTPSTLCRASSCAASRPASRCSTAPSPASPTSGSGQPASPTSGSGQPASQSTSASGQSAAAKQVLFGNVMCAKHGENLSWSLVVWILWISDIYVLFSSRTVAMEYNSLTLAFSLYRNQTQRAGTAKREMFIHVAAYFAKRLADKAENKQLNNYANGRQGSARVAVATQGPPESDGARRPRRPGTEGPGGRRER